MRFAWSLLIPAACAFALSSASEQAQTRARTTCVAVPAAAIPCRAPVISGVAIPFFICTSTGVSCDFDVMQIYAAKKPSSNVSSERRRCFATWRLPKPGYILQPNLRRSGLWCTEKRMWPSSSVSALTDCTCARHEDLVLRPIKFNESAQACKLTADERRDPHHEHFART